MTAIGQASGGQAHARFRVRTDWTQEGFTASHTGHNFYENVIDPSNVGDLGLKWMIPDASTSATPTISGGVIYVAESHSLVALRASDGALLWSTYLAAAPSTATVSHGSVFVGTVTTERFFALDASTGAIRWSRFMGNYVSNGPALVNGLVYVTADTS